MSIMYCCTQTSVNTFPVHTQQKGTGSCKSQGDVRQWWPTNTQWLGADNSMIITVSLMLALCLVLWALQGLVCGFFTFVSLISSAEAAAGSRRYTEGTKDMWVKRWRNFFLHTDLLVQSTLLCLRCSATGHHFIASSTREVLQVRKRHRVLWGILHSTPALVVLSRRKARQKRTQWDFNGNRSVPAC